MPPCGGLSWVRGRLHQAESAVDPAFPFCDADGSIAGQPQTCIEVACTADAFETCQGDNAIVCNAAGNNFVVVSCPFGCEDTTGCRDCMVNSQCPSEVPICDLSTSQCRRCVVDDECESQVCNKTAGECVEESNTVYASPRGNGSCSLNQPCSLTTAVAAALAAIETPLLRMLPGTYVDKLQIAFATPTPLSIVATGAVISTALANDPAVLITGGASVDIRNLTVMNPRAVRCGGRVTRCRRFSSVTA